MSKGRGEADAIAGSVDGLHIISIIFGDYLKQGGLHIDTRSHLSALAGTGVEEGEANQWCQAELLHLLLNI